MEALESMLKAMPRTTLELHTRLQGKITVIKMTKVFWFGLWVSPELSGLSLRALTRQRL